MGIDYSQFQFAKGAPRVVEAVAKSRAEDRAWEACVKAVDERDKRICQVTGVSLSAGHVDGFRALERNHLDPRSLNKRQRFNADVVVTMSRAVHQLWHAGAFWLKAKNGREARRVSQIDYFEWNRNVITRGSEPFTVRKGLAVRKDL